LKGFDLLPFLGAYWGGRFRGARGEAFLKEDPGDLSLPVGRFRSDPSAVGPAVEAARRAAPAWGAAPPEKRVAALRRFQAEARRRAEDLAFVISRETGKPLAESRAEAEAMAAKVDVTLREALPAVSPREVPLPGGAKGRVTYRPLGVAAVIGPFNVPGHLPNGQIVPALLAGNAVVFKPSEQTPFTGQLVAQLWDEAGLPPGVFNLVQGGGAAGAALAAHRDVGAVFFTGSAAVGRKLSALCAEDTGKLLALELGGKNAALVAADAPMDLAVREIVHGAFSTTGQRCSSTSRVLVHRRAAKRFLDAFLPAVDAVRAGYFDQGAFMGPLIGAAAVDRFLGAAGGARKAGFETLREGRAVAPGRRGHYVSPSVRLREGPPRAEAGYADTELFAPDVAVTVCRDEDEMVSLHNASRYGLAAAVFTASRKRFEGLRPRLEAGVVHWNRSTAMSPASLPFGGLKASGNHRPAGLDVLRHCVASVSSVENG
jgi:succinylglutamic semialdehyde dehydrogenase